MFLKLLLITTLFASINGQPNPENIENDIINTSKDIIYYIQKGGTKETKWTVLAVLNDVLEYIVSIHDEVAVTSCVYNLNDRWINLFSLVKKLGGKELLENIYNIIVKLFDEGKYLLTGSLLLTGPAVQEVVGIVLSVVINSLNSINIYEAVSTFLTEVYGKDIFVIHNISLLLLK